MLSPSSSYIKEIKVPYIKTDTIEELGDSDSPEFETIFVVSDFQDSIFNNLCKADCRVIGPPVVLHCAHKGKVCAFCWNLLSASLMQRVLNIKCSK